MSLSEFGQLLRETREKKGLRVEDIALKLKINAKIIRSIEEDNISDALHGTYISSFIRAYSNFLEIDPDEIKNITNSINVENLNEYSPLFKNNNSYISSNLKYFLAIVFFLLIIAGGLWYAISTDIIPLSFNSSDLLTVVKPTPQTNGAKVESPLSSTMNNDVQATDNLKNVEDTNAQEKDNQITADSQVTAENLSIADIQNIVDIQKIKDNLDTTDNEGTNDIPKDIGDNIIVDNSTNNKENVLPLKQDDPKDATNAQILAIADTESNVAESTTTQNNNDLTTSKKKLLNEREQDNITNSIDNESINFSGNTSAGSDTSANVNLGTDANAGIDTNSSIDTKGLNRIIITALEECWIHSSADDTDTRQFTLLKGSTFALAFSEKLVLKFGNAGGVRIHYNGEDLPPVGRVGEVRTVTFPPEQE